MHSEITIPLIQVYQSVITNLVEHKLDHSCDVSLDESTNTTHFSSIIPVDEGVLALFLLFELIIL